MTDGAPQRSQAAGAPHPPRSADAASASDAVGPLTSSPVCFIVEDEPGIRHIIAYGLREQGIQINEFESAPAALDALKQVSPDLFFLDVSLRGSDAIDVIRGLAMHGYRGAVQIMSGKDPALLEEIRRVGERYSLHMLPVLMKPFRADAIRGIIRERFSKRLRSGRGAASNPAAAMPARAPVMDLAEILRTNRFELWYQPKIDLKQRSLAGAEGLVRGVDADQGIIPPSAFLPGASEESMLLLTERVILTALSDWAQFSEYGYALRMALNVPVSALVKLPISTIVRENRPKSEAWPGLILEVTEDQIVRDIPLAQEIATQLKIYNIVLAIDDFGTGYSHLARLRDLPFAELKLDRNLVMNCGEDDTNAALCQTGIDLAHRFGTQAVAEGIEKASELERLWKMGCDLGQGYLFAPPMARNRFISLLRQRAQKQVG